MVDIVAQNMWTAIICSFVACVVLAGIGTVWHIHNTRHWLRSGATTGVCRMAYPFLLLLVSSLLGGIGFVGIIYQAIAHLTGK